MTKTARKKTKKKPPREKRRFAPMGVSEGFREYVLDQLSGVRELRAKSMFGGLGLYSGDTFFGLLAADILFLKVNDATRPGFVRAGGVAFEPYQERASTNYFSVPAAILEDQATLADWARRAIHTARAAKKGRGSGVRK